MSDYIATARVRVRADLRGFRQDLREQIQRSSGGIGAISVPVKPNVIGFKKAMQDELRRATPVVVPVQQKVEQKAATGASAVVTQQRQEKEAIDKTTSAITAQQRAFLATQATTERISSRRSASQRVLTDQFDSQVRATTNVRKSIKSVTDAEKLQNLIEGQLVNTKQAIRAATLLGNDAEVNRLRTLEQSLAVQKAAIGPSIAGINAQTVATRELAAAQTQQAAAAAKAAKTQAAIGRGFLSSALSILGVRGATLAANSAFLAGAAGAVGFAASIASFAKLESELNVFKETAGASADEMQRVSNEAKALGADLTLPGVSATDAAQSFTELAKAGLDVQDSLDGARGVLQLATAAQISNAEATELVASGLNSFGLAGEDAVRVADLLAGAANEAQGSITDVGIALQQSSAAARQAGISIEDTVAILTLLARNGLRGSDAGTSLRTALLRLIRPTDAAQEVFKKFNIAVRNNQGQIRPEVFAEITKVLGGMTKAQRDATLAIIGGQDAFRTFSILGRESFQGLDDVRKATQEQGQAAELAGARTEGLAGQFEAFKNNVATLGTELGEGLAPAADAGLGALNSGLAGLNNALSDNPLEDLQASVEEMTFDELTAQAAELRQGLQKLTDAGIKPTDFGFFQLAAALQITTDQMSDLGPAGTEAASKIEEFRTFLPGAAGATNAVRDRVEELSRALRFLGTTATETGAKVQQALSIPQLLNQVKGLEERVLDEQIEGDRGGQITALRNEEKRLRLILAQEELSTKVRRETKAKLLSTIQQREGIEEEIQRERTQAAEEAKRAAEEGRRKAEQARKDADDALLDSVGLGEQRRQNAIIQAEATKGLNDDIARKKALRNFLRAQIRNIRENLNDTQRAKEEIAEITAKILGITADIVSLKEEQQNAIKEQKDKTIDSITLDVEFAEINENAAAEIAQRQKLIQALKARQRLEKRGTAEWKRLRNEIAQQRKAINEAKKAEDDKKDAFKQLAFAFLQTQQGFAANLFGNLIPLSVGALTSEVRTGNANAPRGGSGGSGGPAPVRARTQGGGAPAATGGAGGVPIDDALAQDGAIKRASDTGPTRGQAQSTNAILRRMLVQLERLNAQGGHPETKVQRKRHAASMDYGI